LYSAHERFIEPDPSFCWISSAVQLAAIQSLMNRRQSGRPVCIPTVNQHISDGSVSVFKSVFFQVGSVFGIGISKYRDICSIFVFFREIYSSCFGVLSKQNVQLFATQHIRFVNAM